MLVSWHVETEELLPRQQEFLPLDIAKNYARKNLVSLFDSPKAEMQLKFLEKVSQ